MLNNKPQRADIFVIVDAILIGVAAIMLFFVYRELVTAPLEHTKETARLIYKASDIRQPGETFEFVDETKNIDEVLLTRWNETVRETVEGDHAQAMITFHSPLKRFSGMTAEMSPVSRQAFDAFAAGQAETIAKQVFNDTITMMLVQGPVRAAADCSDCAQLGFPVYRKGEVIGVRQVAYAQTHNFNRSVKLVLITLALMALILLTTSLFLLPMVRKSQTESESMTIRAASAERQAVTDPLTGLPNRRHFEQSLKGYMIEFGKVNRSFGLMMLDLDRFKSINDNFGHDVGDLVLKEVALRLKAVSREHDVIARFGGEEFAIIAPFGEAQQLHDIAERFRSAIENLQIDVGNTVLRPTTSIGVAVSDPRVTDIHELVQMADQKLYEAKNGGRNRVAA